MENFLELSSPKLMTNGASSSGGGIFSTGPDSLVVNPALTATDQRVVLNLAYTGLFSSQDASAKYGNAFQAGILIPFKWAVFSGYLNGTMLPFESMQLGNSINLKAGLSKEITEELDIGLNLNTGMFWGYNFDWQSKAFFLPKYTPTVVATSFAVEALLSAYETTGNTEYLDTAISSAEFILKDLNVIKKENGYMFSYSPLDTRAVYNATLLGTKTLSLIYKYTRKEDYKVAARASAQAVCDEQNNDGSFPHSDQIRNQWRDSFHTGFKLESLATYRLCCLDDSFDECIEKGYSYWRDNFFVKDTGLAKYYDKSSDDEIIDLHCAAQAIPTICKLGKFQEDKDMAYKILEWAIRNMQSDKGYFYFQMKRNRKNMISYMRWPNAWMFYGISYYLLNV